MSGMDACESVEMILSGACLTIKNNLILVAVDDREAFDAIEATAVELKGHLYKSVRQDHLLVQFSFKKD